VFSVIYPQSIDLIKDRFGNYVYQKIFERGNTEHKKAIFSLIRGHIVELSEHSYGCRVVQKAIDFISHSPEEQKLLIDEINEDALRLI
jgi:pumilio RNA-binding family